MFERNDTRVGVVKNNVYTCRGKRESFLSFSPDLSPYTPGKRNKRLAGYFSGLADVHSGCLPGALAGATQVVGVSSQAPKVAGSIPGQGTYLGCGWVESPVGVRTGDNQSNLICLFVCVCVSLPPFPFSLNNSEKNILR